MNLTWGFCPRFSQDTGHHFSSAIIPPISKAIGVTACWPCLPHVPTSTMQLHLQSCLWLCLLLLLDEHLHQLWTWVITPWIAARACCQHPVLPICLASMGQHASVRALESLSAPAPSGSFTAPWHWEERCCEAVGSQCLHSLVIHVVSRKELGQAITRNHSPAHKVR